MGTPKARSLRAATAGKIFCRVEGGLKTDQYKAKYGRAGTMTGGGERSSQGAWRLKVAATRKDRAALIAAFVEGASGPGEELG
jgi:hypothetical protein